MISWPRGTAPADEVTAPRPWTPRRLRAGASALRARVPTPEPLFDLSGQRRSLFAEGKGAFPILSRAVATPKVK